MAIWPNRSWALERLPLVLSILVLAVGVFYTIANALIAPHPGFTLSSNWTIGAIDACQVLPNDCDKDQRLLRLGDRLTQIGGLTYAQYRSNYNVMPFAGYQPGDVVPLTVIRDGQPVDVIWHLPNASVSYRWASTALFLAFLPFWLAGTVVLLFLRPRGQAWGLLIASNYLLALWVVTGTNGSLQVAGSAYLYIVVSWLILPVYLHFHTVVLEIRFGWAQPVFAALYAGAGLVIGLSLLHLIPVNLCAYAVIVAILMSLGMLVYRWRTAPRPQSTMARLMMGSVGLAFGPALVMLTLDALTSSGLPLTLVTSISLLALAIWPIGYVYAAYRNYLGALEFRANRLITGYSYAILVATIVGLIVFSRAASTASPLEVFASVVWITGAVVLLIALYRPFQRWMERQAYGIVHTSEDILKVMARQLPLVSDEPELIQLLADELLPSLLVRQSALYRLTLETPELVYQRGVEASFTPKQLQGHLEQLWTYRPPGEPGDWVRLAIPLEVQQRRLGLWLFGRRDPDDYYSAQDVYLLRLLANQIAVALENSRLYKTVQKQAEEVAELYRAEKEISRLKSDFLARTSHELRTPLTGILGSLGLVLEDIHSPPEEQRRFIETAYKSASTLLRQVNDLLDMAQIEAGKLTTSLWAVDVGLLLQEVYAEFEAKARLKGLRFEIGGLDPEPCLTWVDPDRTRQILRNLVENALKFTGVGGVRLSAHPDRLAGIMQIMVEDTGIGVPPELQANLFQPFVQVEGGDQRRYGGSGLGLAISRRLAELMGGTVTLYSDGEGKGCTVTLRLRLATDLDAQDWPELAAHRSSGIQPEN